MGRGPCDSDCHQKKDGAAAGHKDVRDLNHGIEEGTVEGFDLHPGDSEP